MIGISDADKVLPGMRAELLNKALENAKYWCVEPSKSTKDGPSDQKWLEVFSVRHQRKNGIDAGTAYLFIKTFMLTRLGPWKKDELAAVITDFVNTDSFDRSRDVPALEKRLQKCTGSITPCQQTSAASKFAMFVKPNESVFIWDQLANRAVRWRNRMPGALRAYYRLAGKNNHDYESYAKACQIALDEEIKTPDFQQKLGDFVSFLKAEGGPMADRNQININFLERRLFDKLLFHEGEEIRKLESKQRDEVL